MYLKKYVFYTFGFALLILFSCNSNKVRKIQVLNKDLKGTTIKTKVGNCKVKYDEYDRLSGKRITELEPENILSFTHKKLKKYFTDRPFLKCEGGLSKNGEEYFINLEFTVDTKYIKTGYNGFSKKSMLRVTLINGDKLFLNNIINDDGHRDLTANKVFYKGVYPINKDDVKQFRNKELDKIGVEWNGGVEEYEVYNIDFLIKQFECLDKID